MYINATTSFQPCLHMPLYPPSPSGDKPNPYLTRVKFVCVNTCLGQALYLAHTFLAPFQIRG